MIESIPTIETERLILRRLKPSDAADTFVFRSDPEVMRYIPRPIAVTENDALQLIEKLNDFADKGQGKNWAIEWKETGIMVGIIGYVHLKPEHFRAEIGYSLARAFHRKGITTEAIKALMRYGFDVMGLHTIEAIIDEENRPSGALLESVGFRQEAHFREDFFYDNSFRNSIHYGILKSEFEKSNS